MHNLRQFIRVNRTANRKQI